MTLRLQKHIVKAKFWKKREDNRILCYLCHRYCIIEKDRYGACGVRKNINGELYTLVYGLLSAVNIDPIEKKPLMHYKPGSSVLSISTVGCNFFCQFCQNYEISQSRLEKGLYGRFYTPDDIVELALHYKANGITYTYNEPTIFYEFMIDVARETKKHNLFNTIVTNGYMSIEAAEEFSKYLDAATIDFKGGGSKEFYKKYMFIKDPEPIFETIKTYHEKGVFIEITNLVVPRIGDDPNQLKKLARWVVDNIGPETPFHLLRFHPDYKLMNIPPTPVELLERLASIARDEGLEYVYIGNVWGHPLENTYCPRCGELIIKRYGFYIEKINLDRNEKCPKCGYKLNIVL